MLLTEPKIQELRETSSEFETTITILKWNCLVFFTGDIIARTAARLVVNKARLAKKTF